MRLEFSRLINTKDSALMDEDKQDRDITEQLLSNLQQMANTSCEAVNQSLLNSSILARPIADASYQEDDEDDSMGGSDEDRDQILYDIDDEEERQLHMNLLLNISKERQSLSGSTQEMSSSLLKQKLHLSLSKLNQADLTKIKQRLNNTSLGVDTE